MNNKNIIERLLMPIILSELDVERIDNLTGALGLILRIIIELPGTATLHFPLLVQAILTNPEAVSRRLICHQKQYWIDVDQQALALEPLRGKPITTKNLSQVLAVIGQVTGVHINNQ